MKQPDYIEKLFDAFPEAYINHYNEIILSESRKGNVYFCLEDVHNYNDCLRKIFSWCSRDASKAMPYRSERFNEAYRQKIRKGLNEFLGKNLSKEEWGLIYKRLGKEINPELTRRFIESGLDMSVLEEEK